MKRPSDYFTSAVDEFLTIEMQLLQHREKCTRHEK